MAKWLNDLIMNAGLTAAQGNKILVCAGQPTDRADAISKSLTDETDGASALVGGDFTQADGDVSGRKQTIAAKAGLPIDASGTADHVAIIDDVNLLLVTTVAAQALTSGGTVDTNSFDHEIQDPA